MGWGDHIMMLGEAETHFRETGQKTYLPKVTGEGEQSMGHNCDEFLTNTKLGAHTIPTDYSTMYMAGRHDKFATHLQYKPYQPIPFALRPTDREVKRVGKIVADLPEKFLALCPDTKTSFYPGKNWGEGKWEELTERISSQIPTVRFHNEPYNVGNLINVPTTSVREAFLCAGRASLSCAYEGGFIHATTGMGVKGVVIWGGIAGPDIVGYKSNRNIFIDHPQTPCGSKVECEHCVEVNAAITVDMVVDAVLEEWSKL